MRTPRLLLYKTGQTADAIVDAVGDYRAWFDRVLAGAATLEVHAAFEQPAAEVAGVDGIVVTGSPMSLVDPLPWMDEAADFVRRAAGAGVPVLGVCFGHQLVGYAFGGRVRINPTGWEVGSHAVELTDEGRRDPLFAGLPERILVNQSHRDEVASLGDGVVSLARGECTAHQAIAWGEHVRGVQFHPEMNALVIRRLIEHRRPLLVDDVTLRQRDARFHPETLLGTACDTPHGEQVVKNFVRHFVARA